MTAPPPTDVTLPPTANGRHLRTASLGTLFLTVFIDLLGFGMVIPFLPGMARRLGAGDFVATMPGAVYSIMQFLFIPIWGRLSDRVGRRPVYLFGAIGVAVLAFPLFWLLDTGSGLMAALAMFLVFIFAHAPMYGPQGAFLSELFGTRVRYSGASLGAQLASVVAGALSPFIATKLLQDYGRTSLALYLIFMAVVTIVAVAIASETHREEIDS